MKTASVAAVFLCAVTALGLPDAAAQSEGGALSPEEARVEAWWLVSAFRFKEAKDLLSSLDGTDEGALETIDALEAFSASLIDLLVERGKTCTFKLKSGGVLKGKPVEFTADDSIKLHNDMVLPLSQLSWESVAVLAKSAAKRKGPEADAMFAAAYLLGGEAGKAKGSLRKAGGPCADTVKALAEDWEDMEDEFTARSLAGIVMSGDVEGFRAAAEKLRDEYGGTDVYKRLKEGLRAALVPLLEKEGRISGELHPIEEADLGGGKRRLIYGFVSANECSDWEFLSFEEATTDIHEAMRGFMINVGNNMAERAGADPMDVELKPEIKDDVLSFPPGSAIRHRLLFRGDITVSCEVAIGYQGFSLPYAVVHGGPDHYLHSFYWSLKVRKPNGQIVEDEAEKQDSYPINQPTTDIRIAVKRTREGTEASLIYEEDDRGKVDAEGVTEGYVVLGAIGAYSTSMTRVIIEGEIVPESLDSLARGRIEAEAERLVP